MFETDGASLLWPGAIFAALTVPRNGAIIRQLAGEPEHKASVSRLISLGSTTRKALADRLSQLENADLVCIQGANTEGTVWQLPKHSAFRVAQAFADVFEPVLLEQTDFAHVSYLMCDAVDSPYSCMQDRAFALKATKEFLKVVLPTFPSYAARKIRADEVRRMSIEVKDTAKGVNFVDTLAKPFVVAVIRQALRSPEGLSAADFLTIRPTRANANALMRMMTSSGIFVTREDRYQVNDYLPFLASVLKDLFSLSAEETLALAARAIDGLENNP